MKNGWDRVDTLMRDGLETIFPAAVLLVVRSGGDVFHRAYGYLDPEAHRRLTQTDSLFDLASVTKLFTATAFMTLVEAGRVMLDTPVADVLTEFNGVRPIGPSEDPLGKSMVPAEPAFAGQPVDARQVTFWHLLTHTSGLAAWRSLYRENGGEGPDVPLPHQVAPGRRARRIAAIHQSYGFACPPGTRVVYSDLGLVLVGEAVARLAGASLEVYVGQSVLDPLGLRHTMYNPLSHGIPRERIVPTEFCAWRQRRCLGEVHDENAASLGGVAGHAGLFSTAWEVGVLGQTFLNGGCYGRRRILSSETVAQMTRPQVTSAGHRRGLAWLLAGDEQAPYAGFLGPEAYGHTGFTGTSLWVAPRRSLVVVLLTNRVYYGRDSGEAVAEFRSRLHQTVAATM